MLNILKDAEKVLVCKQVSNKDKFVDDTPLSYKITGDVHVGDCFVCFRKGHGAIIVQVVDIISAWAYSNERKGLGDIDTMSTPVSKVDFEGHAKGKKARSLARDIDAAIAERVAKEKAKKELMETIKHLDKAEGDELKAMAALADGLRANPDMLDEINA